MSKKPKIDPKRARKVNVDFTSDKDMNDQLTELRKKRGYVDGFAPEQQAAAITKEHPETQVFEPKAWYIPSWFCVLCKDNQVVPIVGPDNKPRNPSPGIWQAEQSYPGLDINKGDLTFYHICPLCAEEWANKQSIGIWTPRGMYHADENQRKTTMLEGIFSWIQTAIMRGEKPIKGQD